MYLRVNDQNSRVNDLKSRVKFGLSLKFQKGFASA